MNVNAVKLLKRIDHELVLAQQELAEEWGLAPDSTTEPTYRLLCKVMLEAKGLHNLIESMLLDELGDTA